IKVSQLMSAFGDHFSTDLSVNNALRLVEIGKGMDLSKLESIGLADPPNNFYLTTLGTITTNIPAQGTQNKSPFVEISKQNGDSSRSFGVDYFHIRQERTTPR